MNARATAGVLLGLGALIVAGLTWRALKEAEDAAAALDRTRAAIQRLEQARRSHEHRRARAEEAAAALAAKPAAAAPNAVAPATPAPAAAPPVRRSNSIMDLIRDDPEGQVLYLATKRATLARTYGPLFRQLQLTREQSAAFQNNILARDERRMDLQHIAGDGSDAKTQTELQRQINWDYDAAQRALLGEAGFAQLQAYERTSWVRGVIGSIAGVAAIEHVPFTAHQADQLVQAFADWSVNYRKGGYAFTDDVEWDRFEARARAILSPQQFEVLSTMDPGPTTPGILQSRMYALVNRAVEAERKVLAKGPAARPRD